MDAWMNRFGSFAEGVVIMVCPVLLTMALKKVDVKREEHGRAICMLVFAAVTLILGIGPFLVHYCSQSDTFPNGTLKPPRNMTRLLPSISSACLMVLACLIIRLIIFDYWKYVLIGALVGLLFMIYTIKYHWYGRDDEQDAATANIDQYCSKLENSLELITGITALMFLGLEGLALEGQINNSKGIQDRLTAPMATSFIVCVLCIGLMLVVTVPPRDVTILTEIFDVLTAFAVLLVMLFIMYSLMKQQAFLLIASPFLILMVYLFHLIEGAGGNNDESDETCDKPASLELTKVTFTGFLAVSIPSISNGSLNMCTDWFLLLAGLSIVSGLIWRILTHIKSDDNIKKTANVASFLTHLCVVIATIPFALMAGIALS